MKRASYTCNTSYGDQEDRLSSLPDVLLIYILSFIDTKLAIQASILSKRWVNLWTSLPILNLNSPGFVNVKNLDLNRFTYDNFVDNVLRHRNGMIKLDSINIKATDDITIARVFRYAITHGVVSLVIDSSEYLTKYRPLLCTDCSSDLLVSLSLKGMISFGKFMTFSSLVSLRLERVKIVESEPFSCFPNLEELSLVNSKLLAELEALEVICFRLKRLKISTCFHHPIPYEKLVLLTPKLVLLEIEGVIPMSFEAPELPFLETIYIDCCFSFPRDADRYVHQPDEDQQKVNLIKIFFCLGNAKYVHLSPSTVELLSPMLHGDGYGYGDGYLETPEKAPETAGNAPETSEFGGRFPFLERFRDGDVYLFGVSVQHRIEKLVEESCPFGNLKVLNLIPPPNKPVAELHPSVAAFLLKGSPRVILKSFPW